MREGRRQEARVEPGEALSERREGELQYICGMEVNGKHWRQKGRGRRGRREMDRGGRPKHGRYEGTAGNLLLCGMLQNSILHFKVQPGGDGARL